ncbi:MAG: TonB-dependent receptor [Acidobacteria bacterium]|nr:TonB-dependent receptor [Acidobacteriota bacterium]
MAAASRRRVAALGIALGLLWTAGAAAGGAQDSSLRGRVTDAGGEPLDGVTVAAVAAGAAAPRTATPARTTTDPAGEYELALAPGAWTVTFAQDGFATEQREDVDVAAGESVELDVTLALSAFAEQVDVVGITPLPGAGVDPDRVPAVVARIDGADLAERGAASFADALHERLGAVTLEGSTTNLFQPTLRFRGFTASPLLGLPQGIAVYQNGVRVNEPFGDTVQFDLLPQFAIEQAQLSAGADPAYGLNAMGGALALQLKDGFTHTGFRGEFSGGAFGRTQAVAEYGANNGAWAFYAGASHFAEDGWRDESPSRVTQAFADVAYQGRSVDAGISLTYADTDLTGNAAAPIELLDVDRSGIFTFPDVTENRLAFVQGRASIAATDVWSVQVTGYYRDLDRATLNGDEAEFDLCDDDLLPPGAPMNTLCAGDDDDDDDFGDDDDHDHDDDDHDHDDDDHDHDDDGDDDHGDDDDDHGDDDDHDHGDDDDDDHDHGDDDDHNGDDDDHGDDDDDEAAAPLVDPRTGEFITAEAGGDGAYNRTRTLARGYGGTVQATARIPVGERENVLVIGAFADGADVDFTSSSEVGRLTPERGVAGSGLYAGIYGLGGDDLFNTDLATGSHNLGLFLHETFPVTDRFDVIASGRFNSVGIDIDDHLGSSLDGRHSFSRFNPSAGAVFRASDTVSVFARYSESNRAPTAAELSCADPDEPCRVPNAFISDPPLEQAVARSVEAGLRGRWTAGGGSRHVSWSAAAFRTRIADDILFIASPELIGTGYFQNAGDTSRLGAEVELNGRIARFGWYASYGLVEATFESPLELPGSDEVNDAATEDGSILVEPGDRLPGIPRHSFKAGIRQGITRAWDVALETIAASSRVFVGDEGNDQAELDGYGIVNFRTAYRFDAGVELFARIENLFDARYATAGVLAELEVHLREVPDARDPRFIGPGPPRSAFAGVRVRF